MKYTVNYEYLKIFLSFCWIIIYFSFSIITFPTITAAENNTIKIGYIDYTGFIDKKPDGSYSGMELTILLKYREVQVGSMNSFTIHGIPNLKI